MELFKFLNGTVVNAYYYICEKYVVYVKEDEGLGFAPQIIAGRIPVADVENLEELCSISLKNPCVSAKTEPGSGYFFYGIYDNFLFVDIGCCPDPRAFDIYDLKNGKLRYADNYSRPIRIKNGELWYWKEKEKATAKNCPKYKEFQSYGGAPMIDELVHLNLYNLKLIKTGETQCNSRQ